MMQAKSGYMNRYPYGERISLEEPNGRRSPWNQYTLISDARPVERGGFRPGTRFGVQEVHRMLVERCIEIGSVFEFQGVRYRVTLGPRHPKNGVSSLILEEMTK